MNDWNKLFYGFNQLPETSDHLHKAGYCGVSEILTPKDRKSEFIIFEDNQVYVKFHTGFSQPILYPYEECSFLPKAKAVLMDLDGTSVKSEEFWVWLIQRTMQELMKDKTFVLQQEDIPYVSGFSVSEHLQYCLNKYDSSGDLKEARKLYYQLTNYEMNEIMHGRGRTDAFTCRENLKEFLLKLKENNIKIGLVTSGLYEKAMPEIIAAFRQMNLGNPFEFYDAIITAGTTYSKGQSGTLGELCAKPHPWLYNEIGKIGLNLTENDRQHTVVMEDSSAGVLSGRLAGYPVIGMCDGNIKKAGLSCLTNYQTNDLMQALEYILGS